MDVLSDILSSMRLSGGVVIDAELNGPSCVISQFTDDHCAGFFPVPAHVIAYHYVRSGRIFAEIPGQPPVEAGPGDIILVPRNEQHLLYSEPGLPAVASDSLIGPAPTGEPARIRTDGAGERVELYCGYMGSTSHENALIQSLPSLLLVHSLEGSRSAWLESSLRYAAEELHNAPPMVVARLTEMLFGEAVRRYIESLPEGQGGWLAGLRDPAVAKALSIIHARYAEALDVNGLAREVGMSRSAFADRFTALIGESPIRYCARWRMRMAANLLRDGRQTSGNVAYDVGFNSEAAFNRAFKREYGMPPSAWRRINAEVPDARAAPEPERSVQQVRYCHARDGTRLAWSAIGDGPPLVKAANWLNHIEHDWDSPLWRHWMDELTRDHRLIRYDERGTGMSDWDTPELNFDAFVHDLECVVDTAEADRFDLLGISQGAAVSIAYAVRHPERVRKLVLVGGYAQGWAARNLPGEAARREAMITLTRTGWGMDNPAFRQMFTSLYIPEATHEQMDWFNEVQRQSASPEMAERLQRVLSQIDVGDLLAEVRLPTLILHARNDAVVPFVAGQSLAQGIPGASFFPLDSANHVLLESEPAWRIFVEETRRFLDAGDYRTRGPPNGSGGGGRRSRRGSCA